MIPVETREKGVRYIPKSRPRAVVYRGVLPPIRRTAVSRESLGQDFKAHAIGNDRRPVRQGFINDKEDGRLPISARIAFGSLFVKERENLPDERTVENIAENPYMQYCIGLSSFTQEPLFDVSMMSHFRMHFTPEMIEQINEQLY